MNAVRVTAETYSKLVTDCRVFFNQVAFTELNKDKVDEVHYLIIYQGNSARFGLILGQKGTVAKCPFSAPYSYPVEVRPGENVASFDEAVEALEAYCRQNGISEITFIFPPLFYDEHILSAWVSAFYRNRYEVINLDLSYALDLDELNLDPDAYCARLSHKGRKGFRKAMRREFTVQRCDTPELLREAYDLIRINHEAKGFPVRMTFDQLCATLALVENDAFIVKCGDTSVLAEFLYVVNSTTVQGIYCGVHPDYTELNSMNFLTYYTIRYYGNKGYRILDKATATENSIPNYGLCDFKDSVGCKRSLKYSFRKVFAG